MLAVTRQQRWYPPLPALSLVPHTHHTIFASLAILIACCSQPPSLELCLKDDLLQRITLPKPLSLLTRLMIWSLKLQVCWSITEMHRIVIGAWILNWNRYIKRYYWLDLPFKSTDTAPWVKAWLIRLPQKRRDVVWCCWSEGPRFNNSQSLVASLAENVGWGWADSIESEAILYSKITQRIFEGIELIFMIYNLKEEYYQETVSTRPFRAPEVILGLYLEKTSTKS